MLCKICEIFLSKLWVVIVKNLKTIGEMIGKMIVDHDLITFFALSDRDLIRDHIFPSDRVLIGDHENGERPELCQIGIHHYSQPHITNPQSFHF